MEIDDVYVDAPRTAQTAEEAVRQRYAEREARETLRREREAAQRKAKEAATQYLIKTSLVTIGQEARAAIKRLQAADWPNGTLLDVVIAYAPVYSGWPRKRLVGYNPIKEELATWYIALNDTYTSSAHLGSDGRIYYFSKMFIDGWHYDIDYHPINLSNSAFFMYSDESKLTKLSDDERNERINRTIKELRKLGSD